MKNTSIIFIVFLGLFILTDTVLLAQDQSDISDERFKPYTANNKGKFFVYGGWNRGYYSRSDVHFQGEDYDFTLHKVKGNDKRTKFGFRNYFQLDRVTIPQTNLRFGYFVSEYYNISLGVDHMKYVMTERQTANISGYIDVPGGNPYNGDYHNQPIYVDDEFLHLEHTDGLNYISAQLERYDDLGSLLGGTWNMDIFQINLYGGIGLGALVPRTDATILDQDRHDEFHLSGFGFSAHQGLNLTFFKYFFIQFELKEGYINMPNIRTTHSSSDKASQQFFFLEPTFMFGGILRI